jgi:peptidoglycan DL-endopeptidase CwlO
VASPRHPSWLLRSLAILAAIAATLGVFALPASAVPRPPAPQTASEARAQLQKFNEQLEILAERYNDATILLAKRRKEFRTADRKARAIQKEYAVLAGQVRQVVSAAYKNVPFGQFTTMLTSGSPREFIDQLSALGLIARRRGALIDRIAGVRANALRAQSQAQSALSDAQKLERDLRARKGELNKRADQSRAMLSRLTREERAAFFASQGTTDRASRSVGRVDVGPASAAAKKAVEVALAQVGDPYQWAATGPDSFDCSGLTMYAWAAAGVALPHSSSAQYGVGTRISRSEVRAGDLVFFYSPIHHVGIAISNSQMVSAPSTGDVVKVSTIAGRPYVGATRVG